MQEEALDREKENPKKQKSFEPRNIVIQEEKQNFLASGKRAHAYKQLNLTKTKT